MDLNSADESIIKDQLSLLQFGKTSVTGAVATYLHGSTLDFVGGSNSQLKRIWLERGDATDAYNLVCSDPNRLLEKFDSLVATLQERCN